MKTKSRRNVWLCCSVLAVKGTKEKKRQAFNSCDQTVEKPENFLSKRFGQESNSITSCICCSVIKESLPPPPKITDQSSYDMEKELSKGSITVTGIPTSK
ncbi:Hypothetical predicted protein [Olea europaea subsp. europaea]|uniref:Uncharacterized protein n=1 Tax=Olea europaea subsp. europaea TaxID=158383 RepID=A0A8S0UQB3_OLEEU|nr:Hypothetical predicted protein [Olea europaea subsp. europaea]CAA3022426.1 Hypothetical predicted protein [Olea europaea subsp. europaea]